MDGDDRTSIQSRALLITGGLGSGKTSIAIEVGELLERRGDFYAVIDLDYLCWAAPDPRFATTIHQLLVRNLVPVVNGFRAAGITWFVLPRLIQSRQEFTLVQDALAAAGVHDVTVVELTVEKDIALQRLQSRDTGANLDSNRDGIAKLHSATDIASVTFATDEMTVEDLAHDVLSHWLSPGD